MARVTLKSVAELAGVGSATVERVLNGRGGVRPALVESVLAAARKLNYPKRLPEQHRKVTRIEVLMARPDLSFLARLSKSFERISASLDTSIVVHRTFLEETNPAAMAAHIMEPKLRRSALIVALPHHPLVTDALVRLQKAGLPIIQLMTRIEDLDVPYVGIDNEAAGRMAGFLMAGMQRRTGSVVALCHSQIYGVHRARLRGFSQFMAKPEVGHLAFKMAAFTRDEMQEVSVVVSGLMRMFPDLVGIYCAGGDYGPLCDMLQRQGRQHDKCLIGHELTAQSTKALKDGTLAAVIDQAPETQARRAIDTALSRLGLLRAPVETTPIRFVTITADTL